MAGTAEIQAEQLRHGIDPRAVSETLLNPRLVAACGQVGLVRSCIRRHIQQNLCAAQRCDSRRLPVCEIHAHRRSDLGKRKRPDIERVAARHPVNFHFGRMHLVLRANQRAIRAVQIRRVEQMPCSIRRQRASGHQIDAESRGKFVRRRLKNPLHSRRDRPKDTFDCQSTTRRKLIDRTFERHALLSKRAHGREQAKDRQPRVFREDNQLCALLDRLTNKPVIFLRELNAIVQKIHLHLDDADRHSLPRRHAGARVRLLRQCTPDRARTRFVGEQCVDRGGEKLVFDIHRQVHR